MEFNIIIPIKPEEGCERDPSKGAEGVICKRAGLRRNSQAKGSHHDGALESCQLQAAPKE